MIFSNRPISQITDNELIKLIGKREDQHTEFMERVDIVDGFMGPRDRFNMLKCITAMANAEGGYIFIGAREVAGLAQNFVSVANPTTIVDSIKDLCILIDPPIDDLEVEARTFSWNSTEITLVIIHIPSNFIYPHGFILDGTNNFVKRYDANVRAYSTYELSVHFW